MKPVKGSSVRSCHATLLKTAEEKTCSGMNFLLERETQKDSLVHHVTKWRWSVLLYPLFSLEKKNVFSHLIIIPHNGTNPCEFIVVALWTEQGRASGFTWIYILGVAGSFSNGLESSFCNTYAHFHLSQYDKKYSLCADLVPPFPFSCSGNTWGYLLFYPQSLSSGIRYMDKAKCQTHVFISEYILPHCKSCCFFFFGNVNKNLLHKIL